MLTKFNLILVACPGFQSRPLLAPTPGIFSPEPAPAPADNYFDFFTTVTKFLKKLFIQDGTFTHIASNFYRIFFL